MIPYRILMSLALVTGGAAMIRGQTMSSDDVVELDRFEVSELRRFSDQAIPGATPVAFTEFGKETIQARLASRDIPLVLNSTPSVFATTDSGGAGDARVNVRGFSQRNVSILINGVPANDIENGSLFWSNWDALGDVTSTIQVQRGMGSVTLPTPSIGGTMNIITDPAAADAGGSLKAEGGSDAFYKATAVVNTGLVGGRCALTLGAVAKRGEGYVQGTWSRGYGYYAGATFIANDRNRLELFAMGAPQRHGQRVFASNIAAYDAGFARELGYTETEIQAALAVGPVDAGADFNPNFAPVSPAYTGQQFYWGARRERHDPHRLNERENYFHRPQINLNWYSDISDTLQLNSVLYYSGGRGGGSGTLANGPAGAAFARFPTSHPRYGSNIDWDATIASNAGAINAGGGAKTPGRSLGILRNRVNHQDQFGVVSKLSYELTPALTLTGGLDWRTAEIDHFSEVRDLLGGGYYLPTPAQASEFWAEGAGTPLGLGDKVGYFNTNTIDWLGLFLAGDYRDGPVTAFGVYGYSTIDYSYADHFRRASPGSGDTFRLDPGSLDGHQVKGGVNYAFTPGLSVFVNAGWVSKVPIFDGVINETTGSLVDTENEKFSSFEAGARWENRARTVNLSANVYHTRWRDRTVTIVVEPADMIVHLRGVDSDHSGVELEVGYEPRNWLRLDAAASYGDWVFLQDVLGEAFRISTRAPLGSAGTVFIEDVKVGDAPQSQLAVGATVRPAGGLSVRLEGRWYDRYWAEILPDSRANPNDRANAWRLPAYSIYDLHLLYDLPTAVRFGQLSVFTHVFNLLDEVYVSDATDNSGFEGIRTSPSHTPQRAEVFLGPPRTYNVGVQLRF